MVKGKSRNEIIKTSVKKTLEIFLILPLLSSPLCTEEAIEVLLFGVGPAIAIPVFTKDVEVSCTRDGEV